QIRYFRGWRLRIMRNHNRYRVTLYEPAPREIPAGASDALAHALGAAARASLLTSAAITIRAQPDGTYTVHEEGADPHLADVKPLSAYRPLHTKRQPTLRQRGARPASGWYWWGGRDPSRLPDPPIPPRPAASRPGNPFVYGFFSREHQLLGYAEAKPRTPASHLQATTIRDRTPAPTAAPEGTFYVIVFEYPKHHE